MKNLLTNIKVFTPFRSSSFNPYIADATNNYRNRQINKIRAYKPSQKSNHFLTSLLFVTSPRVTPLFSIVNSFQGATL